MAILKTKSASEQEQPAGGLSIVAVGMTVRGDLESNGTVKVEGAVEGHVRAANQVLVAKGGVVGGQAARAVGLHAERPAVRHRGSRRSRARG